MFSTELIAAIAKSSFKTQEAFIEARDKHVQQFEVPAGSVVSLFGADNIDSIKTKILAIEGDRSHIWFEGAIESKGSSGRYNVQDTLMYAVKDMQMNKTLPSKVKLHLYGNKQTPMSIHPGWLQAIVDGTISVPTPYPVYKCGQKMVEVCIIVEEGLMSKYYSMAFDASNFNLIPGDKPLTLAEEFGVDIKPTSWKYKVATMLLDTTEKFIQALKCAAAEGDTYRLTDAEEIKKSLERRLKDLISLQIEIPEGAELNAELNNAISAKIMDLQAVCINAKEQKKLGRNCAIKGKYFPQMDGKPFTHLSPNYSELGVNALMMAVGVMIRLYRGDTKLENLVDLCIRHDMQIFEAAVHEAIDGTVNGAKVDFSYGKSPDLKWGSTSDYPRQSMMFDDVVARKAIKDKEGKITAFETLDTYGAFGAGINLYMDARSTSCSSGDARERLGLPRGNALVLDKDTVRIAAETMLAAIEE